MFETIFSLGSFQLRSLSVFEVLAFFVTAMIFWRRAREENYLETKVFDGFLLSFLFGWIIARAGYIVFSWQKFGWDLLKWFNFIQFPGSQLLFGLIGATLFLYFFSRKQKWDAYEILDWWAQAVTMGLIWVNLGYYLAGIRFGNATSLPWGIIFPGVFEKRHPVQLYYLVFHIVIFRVLNWFEYHYRTFEWYRSGKKTAQTGFVFASFVFFYATFSIIISFFQSPVFIVDNFVFDLSFNVILLIFSLLILLIRANRKFFSFSEKKFFAVKK